MRLQVWILGREVLTVELTWQKPVELLASVLAEAVAEHERDEELDGDLLSWPPVDQPDMDSVDAGMDWGRIISERKE